MAATEHSRENHLVAAITGELLQKGIQAARAGNRLLARLHLEKATETDGTNPELWLWLSWVAETPAKAQVYLRKLIKFPTHAATAATGLEWIEALVEPATTEAKTAPTSEVATVGTVERPLATNGSPIHRIPEALLNRAFTTPAPASGLALATPRAANEFPVQCPACDVVLLARNSALGQTRACPACQHRFVMLPKLSPPAAVGVPVQNSSLETRPYYSRFVSAQGAKNLER